MSSNILLVDDDESLLQGYNRILRKDYQLTLANSGQQGLASIEASPPFDVIVSDLQMPGMDGITFLSRARSICPDSVRILLTGNADVNNAINAVNEGNIFRFLTKPCTKEVFVAALEAGIKQYRLIIAEKQLLEETLNNSIRVMSDLLSIANPVAFGCASRVRRYVVHIAKSLGLGDIWQYEVAAMLSQIGCVSVNQTIFEKIYSGIEPTEKELKDYLAHPEVGAKLISSIPRLEKVAKIIELQNIPITHSSIPSTCDKSVLTAVRILQCALSLDRLLIQGKYLPEAISILRQKATPEDDAILKAMESLELGGKEWKLVHVTTGELLCGMILAQDVFSKNEMLLVTKGQEVSATILEHLRRWAANTGVVEPFTAWVPAE